MGCTEVELLRWLPGAVNGRALTLLPRSASRDHRQWPPQRSHGVSCRRAASR